MRKDNINWEEFAIDLIWRNIVSHKNEYSGYDIITDNIPSCMKDLPEEQVYPRGYKPGDILRDTRIFSYWIGPTKQLTWKELALELGIFEKNLTNDGHDCHKCPEEKKCNAYFKYDTDHERCNWWTENMKEEKER